MSGICLETMGAIFFQKVRSSEVLRQESLSRYILSGFFTD